MLEAEGRRQGAKKFAFQDRSGDEFGVKLQRWLKKLRVIDRENDQYREKVWDPETGEVIHRAEGVRPEVEVTHRKCRNDPRSLCVTSTSGLTPSARGD
jgi:hypothetical protein